MTSKSPGQIDTVNADQHRPLNPIQNDGQTEDEIATKIYPSQESVAKRLSTCIHLAFLEDGIDIFEHFENFEFQVE